MFVSGDSFMELLVVLLTAVWACASPSLSSNQISEQEAARRSSWVDWVFSGGWKFVLFFHKVWIDKTHFQLLNLYQNDKKEKKLFSTQCGVYLLPVGASAAGRLSLSCKVPPELAASHWSLQPGAASNRKPYRTLNLLRLLVALA